MDKFWIVTLFHFLPDPARREMIQNQAMEKHQCLGIEEFSLSEAEVDQILGERAYSGGDVPESVLDEVEGKVLGLPTHYRFFFESQVSAEKFLHYCQSEILAETQIEEQKVQDWNAEWKKHYSPIRINEQFEIIPAWMSEYQPSTEQYLYINPGMGFGTGSHETTFLCLQLLTENLEKEISAVLDFGSGSGILGLASLKFRPQAQVDFYDIDPEANKNCYQNAILNNLEQASFRLLLPEVRSFLKPKYDLVFANILENILILEKNYLTQLINPEGVLILSGLLKPQVENVIKHYQELGMRLTRQLEKGDWAALSFMRIKD